MSENNRFVFVAPIFNAASTLAQMLASIVGQSYSNWRVELLDDVSDPRQRTAEHKIIRAFQHVLAETGRSPNQIQVTWNSDDPIKGKQWEVANVLKGINTCEDDDIICRIDGDDWLTDLDALAQLNACYTQYDVDVVWSNHRWGFSDKNISGPMPPNADPYAYAWVSSHLKTFRKRLINGINDTNFRGENGEYIRRAGDQAIFLPILYQTRKRVHIPRCFYHYTIKDVPETYQTDDAKFQRDEALFLRKRGFVQ